MILHCSLLLLFLNCVKTTDYIDDYGLGNSVTKIDETFSFWPSVHNGVRLMSLHKRETQGPAPDAHIEGGGVVEVNNQHAAASVTQSASVQNTTKAEIQGKSEQSNVPGNESNSTASVGPVVQKINNTEGNNTLPPSPVKTASESTVKSPNQLNVNNRGVLMRGLIVFGGFVLLATAYFIFHRNKNSKNDAGNTHNTSDANQFRYGILQSDDKKDLELSRVPLTMESDEDDDEDLEIFDLEQKKKSLSYVNLQTNDEDVVFQSPTENSTGNYKDNLLLDIEDGSSDNVLINWSNNGNKSIL